MGLAAVAAFGLPAAGNPKARLQPRPDAAALALQSQLRTQPQDLAAFYGARGSRPLWFDRGQARPAAGAALAMLRSGRDDGLDAARYDAPGLERLVAEASDRDADDVARADLALSQAVAAYLIDLHTPNPRAAVALTDPELKRPASSPGEVLMQLASAPSLEAGLTEARRMHPLYEQMRTALRDHRRQRQPPADTEQLIRANLERARALPADPGRRYILVDVAAQQLLLYEDGVVVDEMAVVVGKPSMQTPNMAGMIRYALYAPHWNIPVDLARDTFAPRVIKHGPQVLAAERIEVLSDWTNAAVPVSPETVDWQSVAAGRTLLRMRQKPGPDNMMGRVKFMLPNTLGIYLHDTPIRSAFAAEPRTLSSGCVRLEDAGRLGRWLLGRDVSAGNDQPDRRVDLAAPTPVYMIYLTAAPGPAGLVFRDDIYGRDRPLIAALQGPGRATARLPSGRDVLSVRHEPVRHARQARIQHHPSLGRRLGAQEGGESGRPELRPRQAA